MIHIIGTGIVGLTLADHLLNAGHNIKITTANKSVDDTSCSWWAGGMLAPYCEMESAEPLVGKLAPISMAYWQTFCQKYANTCDHSMNGTLVISPNRDNNMLTHFAQKTQQWQRLTAPQLHELEPILSKHNDGLFYANEGHIEPRQVLKALWERISNSQNADVITNTKLTDDEINELSSNLQDADWLIDCRGFGAKQSINTYKNSEPLRGVRGEMLHFYNPELTLSRPIRLLHPRIPIYLVPRANQQFMLGATMIENGEKERASVRSVMELLSALYAVNPAFAQSEIVEIGVDVRPAYPDNLPKIYKRQNYIAINGMYRHGYLLAPVFTKIVNDHITQGTENELIETLK